MCTSLRPTFGFAIILLVQDFKSLGKNTSSLNPKYSRTHPLPHKLTREIYRGVTQSRTTLFIIIRQRGKLKLHEVQVGIVNKKGILDIEQNTAVD